MPLYPVVIRGMLKIDDDRGLTDDDLMALADNVVEELDNASIDLDIEVENEDEEESTLSFALSIEDCQIDGSVE